MAMKLGVFPCHRPALRTVTFSDVEESFNSRARNTNHFSPDHVSVQVGFLPPAKPEGQHLVRGVRREEEERNFMKINFDIWFMW